jgi:hypothetical protein
MKDTGTKITTRLKVVAIMVHKASIPAAIAQKLGLK